VLLITMEDTRYFVVLRLLARFADIDLTQLTLRTVKTDSYHRLVDAINVLSGLPFDVLDASSLSTDQIRAVTSTYKEQYGLDLLIVDHLLETEEEAENETQRVTKAAKGYRDIAKDEHIPVLLLHQLNRAVEMRSDKRPILSDLKQAGKVEEAARVVWFLYRGGYYAGGEAEDHRRDAELIVAKSSHGPTGTVKLWQLLSRMSFRGWDRSTDGPFPELDQDYQSTGTEDGQPWTPAAAAAKKEEY
jgi:replicative DNA helicase